jgi:hypothetical protein
MACRRLRLRRPLRRAVNQRPQPGAFSLVQTRGLCQKKENRPILSRFKRFSCAVWYQRTGHGEKVQGRTLKTPQTPSCGWPRPRVQPGAVGPRPRVRSGSGSGSGSRPAREVYNKKIEFPKKFFGRNYVKQIHHITGGLCQLYIIRRRV